MGPWGLENMPGAQGRARVPEKARGHDTFLLLGCISQLGGSAGLLRKTCLQGHYNVGQPLPERTGDRVGDALQQGHRDPWAARTRLTGSALQRMVGSVSSDPAPAPPPRPHKLPSQRPEMLLPSEEKGEGGTDQESVL